MGGPITKVLASAKAIVTSSAAADHTYYTKSDGRRKLNVYFYGLADSGTPNVTTTVQPVIPGKDGTTTVIWPDFSDLNADGTVDSTVPAVTPDQGTVTVVCTDVGVAGLIIVDSAAMTGSFRIVVSSASATNVAYTLVAEFI